MAIQLYDVVKLLEPQIVKFNSHDLNFRKNI